MRKLHFIFIILLVSFQLQCKKIASCNEDICSSDRITKQSVINQEGVMGTYLNNNDSRWMINVFNDIGGGLKMTCIICGNIPDTLKVMNKRVVFSGELKDACGVMDDSEESTYYILTPSAIQ